MNSLQNSKLSYTCTNFFVLTVNLNLVYVTLVSSSVSSCSPKYTAPDTRPLSHFTSPARYDTCELDTVHV